MHSLVGKAAFGNLVAGEAAFDHTGTLADEVKVQVDGLGIIGLFGSFV